MGGVLKYTTLISSALVILFGSIGVGNAQEHLVPEQDSFGQEIGYHQKVRHLFDEGFRPEVLLKVVIFESFSTESVIGIRKVSSGFEAFSLRAKTSIGDTELLKYYEEGKIFLLDRDGNQTPGVETEGYRELKERTPADFRDIEVEHSQRGLSKKTVDEVADIWRAMLLETRYSKKFREGKDGTNYYFAIRDLNWGMSMSGRVWSPDKSSRTRLLVQLAESLKDFIETKITEEQFRAKVKTTRMRLKR
ncbi:MAG TPA: hypothetical protein VJT11_13605 [Nitrospiraceae bacterium]|nr:hypothetical protein [Nitrospiraceae bacterium]